MSDAIEVRLDTPRQKLRLVFGLLVVLVFAGFFVYAVFRTESAAKHVLAAAVAALLLAAAGALGYGGLLATKPQAIRVDETGISRVSSGRTWQVDWPELTGVRVEYGYTRVDRSRLFKLWVVRLVLSPVGPEFATRHPELERYHGRFGATSSEYAIAFGPARELVPALDRALLVRAGATYTGTVDLGQLRRSLL